MYFFRPIQRIIILRTKLIVAQFPCLRWLNIRVEETPNEHAMKFIPEGRQVMGKWKGLNFGQHSEVRCPLAKQLYLIAGVASVFYGPDFITITKLQQKIWNWNEIKPKVESLLREFLDSQPPLENTQAITKEAEEVAKTLTTLEETVIPEESSDVYCNIKEVIINKIRPILLEDGGDIELEDFNPTSGTVTIQLLGSCQNCPSSEETLKYGIENMLKFYVPEVKELIASKEPVILTKADVEKFNETKEQNDRDQLIQSKEKINKFEERDNSSIESAEKVNETREMDTASMQADNHMNPLGREAISLEPLLVTKQIVDALNDMCLKHLKSISDKDETSSNLTDEIKQKLYFVKDEYEALADCIYTHMKTFIEENENMETISLADKQIGIIQIISNDAIIKLDSLLLQLQNINDLSNLAEEIQQDKEVIQSLTYSAFYQLINLQEELSDYEKYMKNVILQPNANLEETTNKFLENLKINVTNELDSKTPDQISYNSDDLSEDIISVIDLVNTMREETLKRFETNQESNPFEKYAFEVICEQKEQRLEQLIKNVDQGEDIDVVRKEIEIEKKMIHLINKESINYLNKVQPKFNEASSINKIHSNDNEDLEKKQNFIQQKKQTDDNINEEKIEEILDDFINEPESNYLNSITFEDHDSFWAKQNQNLITKQILKNQFFLKEIQASDEMIVGSKNVINEPIKNLFTVNIKLDKLIDNFLIKHEEKRIKDYIALEKKIITFENEAKEQTLKDFSQQTDKTNEILLNTEDKTTPTEILIKNQIKEYQKIEKIEDTMIPTEILIKNQIKEYQKIEKIEDTTIPTEILSKNQIKEYQKIEKIEDETIPTEILSKDQIKEYQKIKKIEDKMKDDLENTKIDEKIVCLLLEQSKTMNKLTDILANWCQEQNKIDKNINDRFNEVTENLKLIQEQREIYEKKDKENRKRNVSHAIEKTDEQMIENKGDDLKLTLKEYLMEIKNNIKEMKSNKKLANNIGDLYGEIADILGYNVSQKLVNENSRFETKEYQQNQALDVQHKLKDSSASMNHQPTLKFTNFSANYLKNFSQMIILLETECHNLSITLKEFEMLLAETDTEPVRDNNMPVTFKEKIQNMRSRKKIQEHQRYLANIVLDADFEFGQIEKHVEQMRDALLFLEKELDILKDTAKGSRKEFDILEGKSREYLKAKQKILNYVPFAKMILENEKSTRNDSNKEIESYIESGSQMDHSKSNQNILDMDQICRQAVNAKKEFDNEESLKKLKITNDNKRLTYHQIHVPEIANNLNISISNEKDSEKNEKVLNLLDTISNFENSTNQIDGRDEVLRRYYIENNMEIKKKPSDSGMTTSFEKSHSALPNMNSHTQFMLETQKEITGKELSLRKFIHK